MPLLRCKGYVYVSHFLAFILACPPHLEGMLFHQLALLGVWPPPRFPFASCSFERNWTKVFEAEHVWGTRGTSTFTVDTHKKDEQDIL
jgi:hypothetical protein